MFSQLWCTIEIFHDKKQKQKTLQTDFSIFCLFFNKALSVLAIPFSCSRRGWGGRGHRTSCKPIFICSLQRGWGFGERRALPHSLSQAWHLWSDPQKATAHNHQAHTVCDNSLEGLALVTSCPSQGGHQPAGGHREDLESDPPPRRTAASSNAGCPGDHTAARKSWLALGFAARLLTHRLKVCAARLSLRF